MFPVMALSVITAHSVSVVLGLVWTPTRVVAKAPSAAANSSASRSMRAAGTSVTDAARAGSSSSTRFRHSS